MRIIEPKRANYRVIARRLRRPWISVVGQCKLASFFSQRGDGDKDLIENANVIGIIIEGEQRQLTTKPKWLLTLWLEVAKIEANGSNPNYYLLPPRHDYR